MTKKTKTAQAASANKPMLPLVSVCTPTFNRRPFIPILFECFRNQTYPKSRIEWVIIDDGTDKIGDLVDAANIPQIKYFTVDKKMTLGAKRNMMHEKTRGSILVYMDDDDYYPPERISHAVETLMRNPQALCAGASEIYLYFKNIKSNLKNPMYQFGPYGPNHATAATFAFRRDLLNLTRYDSAANVAEERAFLKEYTIPFAQLDPLKTILVFSHEHNSFDKRTLLENPNPNYTKISNKTVDMFIKFPHEARIKKFFLEDIDELLRTYTPGEPRMKPDVMKQIQDIKEQREKQAKEMADKAAAAAAATQGGPQIMMHQPGGQPVAIGMNDAVGIINQQQQKIKQMSERIQELETNSVRKVNNEAFDPTLYQKKITELEKKVADLEKKERDLRTEVKFLTIRNAELTSGLQSKKTGQDKVPATPPGSGTNPVPMSQTGLYRKTSTGFNATSKCEPEVFVAL
jgi:glycosyltransferase involved in cell wall biosynthesis